MPASISFVADNSQFVAANTKSAQSVATVATAAEAARQKIVQAFEDQINAAKAAGASQRQLDGIMSRSASMFAAVTEENAQRYSNAIDRQVAKTQQLAAARAELLSTSGIGSLNEAEELDETAAAFSRASEAQSLYGSGSIKFGAVLRGLQGNFGRNMRAAEAFGSTLSFLTPIIDVAFPIVGAVVLGDALIRLGKNAYDAYENIVNLKGAIAGLNTERIHTDQIIQEDKDKQESDVERILIAQGNRGAALAQKFKYQSGKGIDLSSFFYSKNFSGLPDDVKGNLESTYKDIAPDEIPARIHSINDAIRSLKQTIADAKDHQLNPWAMPSYFGASIGSLRDPQSYYEAQLNAATQVRDRLQATADVRTAGLQGIQADQGQNAQQTAERNAEKMREAANKAQAEQRQRWQQELAEWQASGSRSEEEIAQWWAGKAATFGVGAANFQAAMRNANEALTKINADSARQWTEYQKTISEIQQEQVKAVQDGPDTSSASEDGKNYATWTQNVSALRKANEDNANALTAATIQQKLADGEITKAQAAYQMAALHAHEYAQALAEIKSEQAALDADTSLSDSARRAQQSGIDLQAAQAAGKNAIQTVQDNAKTAANSWAESMRQANQQWVSELNGSLSRLITGQKVSWSSMFESVASSLANLALGGLEKSIGSGLSGSSNGVLSTIGSFFGGGRAIGGGVDAGTTYLVGESGPELLTMGNSSGHITPNHMLGGGQVINYSIDARGTDPALTEMRTRAAIMQSHKSAVHQALQQQHQRALRSPMRG